MTNIAYRLAFACALLLNAIAAEADTDKRIESMLKAWETRQDNLQAVRVTWDQRVLYTHGSVYFPHPDDTDNEGKSIAPAPADDTVLQEPVEVLLDGRMLRYKTTGLASIAGKLTTTTYDSTFDGDTSVLLTGNPEGPGHVTYFKDNGNTDKKNNRLLPLLMNCRPLDPEFELFTNVEWKVVEEASQVDGSECLVLEGSEHRIWVDPASDYVIRKQEWLRSDGGVDLEATIRYEAVASGIQVPSSWNVEWLRSPQDTTTRSRVFISFEGTVTKFEIQPHLTKSDFQFDVPPGTEGYDQRTREILVTKVAGEKQVIRRLPEPGAAPNTTLQGTTKMQSRRLWLIVGANVLLLIALAAFWMRRRRESSA